MTEFWVSQGNKWCDFCKIFISNNRSSIGNHELGQRHKENVAKRLANMRKESAAKEKERKEAARALQQIEAKAKRSYQKDVASFEARDSNALALHGQEDWDRDSSSGYYYNQRNGLYYDPKSGFYYSDAIEGMQQAGRCHGKRHIPRLRLDQILSQDPSLKKPSPTSGAAPVADSKSAAKSQNETAPGPVVSNYLNPMRSVKGSPSSLAVKRKRQDEKPKTISKEEEAALKAREAAKKRVEERKKPLLGLYNGSR